VRLRLTATALLMMVGLCPGGALAGTLSTTGSYGVDVALAITKNADINFGTVKAATSDTYTIGTTGTVTHSGSGTTLYGTPAAGNLTITGSTSQTINISVGSYSANNGVTLQNAVCNYNSSGDGTCSLSGVAAPRSGKTLLLGVDAVVDGTQAAGTSAAPTFIVTVTYP
jgi:Domain of unknown function (DUF4402)